LPPADIKIVDVVDVKTDRNRIRQDAAIPGDRTEENRRVVCWSRFRQSVADAVKRVGGGRELVAFDVNQDTLDGIKADIDGHRAKALHHGIHRVEGLDEVFTPRQATEQGLRADASPRTPSSGYRNLAVDTAF